jgi:hypothetical protein
MLDLVGAMHFNHSAIHATIALLGAKLKHGTAGALGTIATY